VHSRLASHLTSFAVGADPDLAWSHIEAAEAELAKRPESAPYAYLCLTRSMTHGMRSEVEKSQAAARRGIAAARASGHEGLEANGRCLVGWSMMALGDTAAGVAETRAAWEQADASGHVPSAFLTAFHGANVLIHLRDPEAAEERLQAELQRPRLDGAPHLRALLVERRIHVAFLAGRLDEAATLLDRFDHLNQPLLRPLVRGWREGEIGAVNAPVPLLTVCDLDLDLEHLLRLAGRTTEAQEIIDSVVHLLAGTDDDRLHMYLVHAAAAEAHA
jgi:hypothetical protein